MTINEPLSGTRRGKSAPITPQLIELAQRIDSESPPAPQRIFVKKLIMGCREVVGDFCGTTWYRKLMTEAGVKRTPSQRTLNQNLADLREGAGEPHGVTNKAIAELGKMVKRVEAAVGELAKHAGRIADAHSEIRDLTERQVAIAEALQKRQLKFSDDSQVYWRIVEELQTSMKNEAARFLRTAQNMDGIGLQFSIQANRVAQAVDALTRELQNRHGG